MMNRSWVRCLAISVVSVLVAVSAPGSWRVLAAGEQPPGPDRSQPVTQGYTAYEWWLTDWGSNQVACSVIVNHDGLPTRGEVYTVCGKTLYDKWVATEACLPDGSCNGYYLQLNNTEPAERKVSVNLPPPVVWVSLDGCVTENSTYRCDTLPTLVLTGDEPMEGERITGIAGRMDGKDFTCDAVCQIDLAPTSDRGLQLEFWALSSYGDTSVLFTARVRVTPTDDSPSHGWFVDVLSSQWRGAPLAGCSQTWDVFPTVGGVPDWLSTPASVDDLATNVPYQYLAANLIKQGAVDASVCSDSGLLPNGMPSTCGMETARSEVDEWQNRFDGLIQTAAQDTGIPARLLKNIFSRESQFWPGAFTGHPEAGLGQLTSGGADTTLMWNFPFFEQFCSTMLDGSICQQGYAHLTSAQQQLLQGALVSDVNAYCPDCSMDIDMARTEKSVDVFAQTLLANCEQTGLIVHNTYGGEAGASASYEDLWRFTLVNYNAGSGCLTLAIWDTKRRGEKLDWVHLSSHLTPVCHSAIDYVTYMSTNTP